jgi:hypothetical protein
MNGNQDKKTLKTINERLKEGATNERLVLQTIGNLGLLTSAQISRLLFRTATNKSAMSHKILSRLTKRKMLLKRTDGLQIPLYGLSKLGADFLNLTPQEENNTTWYRHSKELTPDKNRFTREKLIDYLALLYTHPGWDVIGERAIVGQKIKEFRRFKAVAIRKADGYRIGIIGYASSVIDTLNRATSCLSAVNEVRIICTNERIPMLEKALSAHPKKNAIKPLKFKTTR